MTATEERERMTPEQVRAVLADLLSRIRALRVGVQVPPLADGPVAVLEAIREIRARLDQIEEHLGRLIRLRGVLRRAARRAQDIVDDKWAEYVGAPSRPVRGDYSGSAPRERYAEADLAVLELRRAQRSQAELAEEAVDAVDEGQLAYRGLSDMRRDMHTMLRGIEIESSLDR